MLKKFPYLVVALTLVTSNVTPGSVCKHSVIEYHKKAQKHTVIKCLGETLKVLGKFTHPNAQSLDLKHADITKLANAFFDTLAYHENARFLLQDKPALQKIYNINKKKERSRQIELMAETRCGFGDLIKELFDGIKEIFTQSSQLFAAISDIILLHAILNSSTNEPETEASIDDVIPEDDNFEDDETSIDGVIPEDDNFEDDEVVTRKASASNILGGLAVICAQGGMIVGAEDDKAKKQAVLNLASSVLALASEVAKKNPTNQPQQIETMTKALLECISLEPACRSTELDQPCLKALLTLPNREDVHYAIEKIFESKDRTAALISELCSSANDFITEHGILLLAGIHDIIGKILHTTKNEPVESVDPEAGEEVIEGLRSPHLSCKMPNFSIKNKSKKTLQITMNFAE